MMTWKYSLARYFKERSCSYLALVCLLLSVLVFASASHAQESDGSQIYKYLVNNSALDSYMSGFINRIVQDLSDSRLRINAPYDREQINIYVIHTGRFPSNALAQYGIKDFKDAHGHEPTGIVLLDVQHVRELVALSFLYWEQRWSMPQSVATLKLEGLEAARSLWDPSRNPRLRSDEVEHWRIALRGALAFVIAHEMGHIVITNTDPAMERTPIVLKNKRQYDIRWLCPELLGPQIAQQRQSEQDADSFAVRLLKVKGKRETYNRYEVGAEWYLSYLLEKSFIKGIENIKNLESKRTLKRQLTQRYGSERFEQLRQIRSQNSMKGPISVLYPRTHPSVLSRLYQSFGADREIRDLMTAWSQRIDQECASLGSR